MNRKCSHEGFYDMKCDDCIEKLKVLIKEKISEPERDTTKLESTQGTA
jgi:hypothetical protein